MYKQFTKRDSKFRYLYFPVLLLLILSLTSCDIFKSDGSGEQNEEEEEPIEEPSEEPPETTWYKGNLHAHSYWTDGGDYPDMILNWYKEEGYSFAVVSGHNSIHERGEGIDDTVRVANNNREYFLQRYLDSFGDDWVDLNESGDAPVVTLKTYDQYSNKLTDENFLAIRAQEIDYRDGNNPNYEINRLIHVNAINIQEEIEPSDGGDTPSILQEIIDKVEAQKNRHNVPMLATVNHPNIRQSISPEELMEVDGARFFEVYSGHPNATNEGHSSLASTEEIWDEVLTHYLQNGKDILYGVASDDAHGYNFEDGVTPDANLPGRGWVAVNAEELTPDAITRAMNEGKFYASTGVELSAVTFEDGTLSVWVEEESGVSYDIQFIGTKSDQPDNPGVVLAEETGTEASYSLEDNDMYVRAKIISDKDKTNASSQGEVEVAYVQPVVE